jgi:hypothetical protein
MPLRMPQNPSMAAASMMRNITNKTKAMRRYSGSEIIVAVRLTRAVMSFPLLEPLQVSHQARPSLAATSVQIAGIAAAAGCLPPPARTAIYQPRNAALRRALESCVGPHEA